MQKQNQSTRAPRMNVEIDPSLREAVNKARIIEGRNLQKVVDMALRLWLEKNHPDLLPAA